MPPYTTGVEAHGDNARPKRRLTEPATLCTLSRAQVRAMDRWAIDELGIPGLVLMENAAAAIEEALLLEFAPALDTPLLIVCGPGNNGGDGLALARRLANRGFTALDVALARSPDAYRGDAAANLRILERMGMRPRPVDTSLDDAESRPFTRGVIVDALFGTGLDRPLEGADIRTLERINALGACGARVLAVDLPSGLDADSGRPLGGIAVRAEVTVTLAALKPGLTTPEGRVWAGKVLVGDIGIAAHRFAGSVHGPFSSSRAE
jgi:hydroxyethylthiazole kinase-like uncharacterized protein yjeF